MVWRRWRDAMTQALYGPGGFYHRPEGGPGAHYRTSTTASVHFASALARLATLVDGALGHPAEFTIVDVGAARGALLAALTVSVPDRFRLVGVELAERPDGLPPRIEWASEIPAGVVGLLIANEWLDNVPCDVVEQTAEDTRYVEVAPDGTERLGDPVTGADAEWLATWWPLEEDGTRAEVGLPRDHAWHEAVARVDRGLAVAIDYGHVKGGRPPYGTLTGYRSGRPVPPVPDGGCDITAHVALDATAAVGPGGIVTTQRQALRALGVSGALPSYDGDQAVYAAALQTASEQAELIAPGGLGDFGWVLHGVGVAVPPGIQ